ncbi:MAG: DUF885 domain-containing protein [Ignavibacteriales bacterium CG_4_9_14_3_um_filter_30_11]|nr:MAG: DUF885 domain-containing protein [Ignavibacteriales bacterium CG_4_9_14_3_um_filter_30_11]
MKKIMFIVLLFSVLISPQNNKQLSDFAHDFFAWRTISQPVTGDDIPRIEKLELWVPNYSPESLKIYKAKYIEFKNRLTAIPIINWTLSDSVDYLLLRSAVERVNWEINVLKLPESHPEFYVSQTIGSLFDLLLISSPFTEQRAKNYLARLDAIPKTVEHAKKNLTSPIKPFAQIAVFMLKNIREKLNKTADELEKIYPDLWKGRLNKFSADASRALENYSEWLTKKLPTMTENFNVGRDNYNYFLRNIALVPYSPEELLRMGKQEWERAVAFDTYEKLRNANIPEDKIFNSMEEQIAQEKIDELEIRKFLEGKNILTIPVWTQHYLLKEFPEYLKPLNFLGVNDDLTSISRSNENAYRYITKPSKDMGFFQRSAAIDPRPLMIHEGMPGHYFQLILSSKNPNFIRQHYFDSNSNEGIGFYVEEVMLQLGLFDNKPHTREIIYSYMRLRALRVDVDINLALGNYSINDAGNYLEKTVPMDKATADAEAMFFALAPGQAITYQIGKIQILKLISDAKIKLGDKFSLKNYHDYMMINGNVPIALQRWEYLGLKDEINTLWK